MKNINIPEPCSEDWNEMTPNEKGAFCKKCALDVYDFTNKSPDEIRQVLTLNMANPVCMRIEPKQLDQLNSDFSAWKIQNKQSYQRAWLFTLIVVFGMTLFSCEEDEVPVVKEYQKIGQAILNQAEEMVVDPLPQEDIEVKTIEANSNEAIQAKEVVKIECFEGEILGKPSYTDKERLQEVHVIQEIEVISEPYHLQEVYATAGVPMMTHEYDVYLLDTYEGVVSDSIELMAEPKITGLAYPNPASNQTTIQVEMPKRGKAEIELFTMTGQKIRTIHSGRIRKGKSEYSLDLTSLETGMYLVVVYSGGMKETIKFSKI